MAGTIAAVPSLQPLASDDIWRVVLDCDPFVRVVRPRAAPDTAAWELLALGDMTDDQLDIYEAAVSSADERCCDAGQMPGF